MEREDLRNLFRVGYGGKSHLVLNLVASPVIHIFLQLRHELLPQSQNPK